MVQHHNKKVCFSERDNRIVEFECFGHERPPHVDPRKRGRTEAQKLIPKGYGSLLLGCFENPTKDCQDNMNAFVADIPDIDNARGLERYLSPEHREERDCAREEIVEAVLTRQRYLARNRHELQRGGGADDASEKLRAVSRRYSRTSRNFARRMAIADELAVQLDIEEEHKVEEVVVEEEPVPTTLKSSYLLSHGDAHPVANDFFQKGKCLVANAKMACRQPSLRELNVGIRSMAACMNAKKACRQASTRQLNVSIRNLASTLNSSNHGSSNGPLGGSIIPPSMMGPLGFVDNSSRRNLMDDSSRKSDINNRAMRRKRSNRSCAQLIQNALDLVERSTEDDEDEEETPENYSFDGSSRCGPMVISA